MAAEAGLRTWETDAISVQDVWVNIEGYHRRTRLNWEMTRAVCFNVAKFGQSDPKSFPRSPQRYWAFPWDIETEEDEEDPMKQALDNLRLQAEKQRELNSQ